MGNATYECNHKLAVVISCLSIGISEKSAKIACLLVPVAICALIRKLKKWENSLGFLNVSIEGPYPFE